jgi:hypothetical protein
MAVQINMSREAIVHHLVSVEPRSEDARRGRELISGYRQRNPTVAPRLFNPQQINLNTSDQMGIIPDGYVANDNLKFIKAAFSTSRDVLFSFGMTVHIKMTGGHLGRNKSNAKPWKSSFECGGNRKVSITFKVIITSKIIS